MSEINTRHDAPLYIKVHANDNVAIVVNPQGLAKGTLFPCGLRLIEHVPQGHKTALINIAAGEAIIRYGETIGYAQRDILRGGWIDESLVTLPAAPALDSLPLANRVPPPLPPLEGYTFDGYRNADGSVGTKNLLGITTSVHCVAGVVDFVVKIIERDLLPQYPNVDGVVALNHLYGCGVAINAPAAVVPIRTIHNLALNPNFGGEVMVVGLGCCRAPRMCSQFRWTPGRSCACRMRSTSALNRWWTIFWRWRNGTCASSISADASLARRQSWWSVCSAAAATLSPASPPTRRWASPPICWCAAARR